MTTDHRAQARALAGDGESTAWFETLYARAETGGATVPWADLTANPLLTAWAARRSVTGPGRAAVVGCGYGDDAEFLATLGFDVTAFDIAPTAVERASRRFPGSAVSYVAADLLDPPRAWSGAFDLVVEIYTVQVLQGPARTAAIEQATALVAPGGTLLVLARARDDDDHPGRMPWPLTRAEIGLFATGTSNRGGLREVAVERIDDGEEPPVPRWVAEFQRSRTGSPRAVPAS
ncbi:class I SAM-dependent methyltransferase [Dactylosporangium sp. NPDC005572]|uniref:class I SAM-dependent methyltransferase n=1 Tax=Dactylosporangium sp. NPDC005572 TaxID=3156889 RepID=UPI0033B174F1